MYIAIDIGGTKTLVVLFDENKNVLGEVKFETPKDYQAFTAELGKAKNSLGIEDTLISGAIGCRGAVDRDNGILIEDDKLGWKNATLCNDANRIFGVKFFLENDSKLAGLSEAHTIEQPVKKVLYVTVSTGIGSAFVVDGALDSNTIDSEIGKWIFEHDGILKEWEAFASGSYLTNTFGKRASELEDESAWRTFTQNLALGIVNACAAYTPNIIILGGGVGAHYEKYAGFLREAIDPITPYIVKVPDIIGAKDPERAVINGCYELARQKA